MMRGLGAQRTGQGNPLLLAARQLMRIAVKELRQMHPLQQFAYPGTFFFLRAGLQTKGDIVRNAQMREQGKS